MNKNIGFGFIIKDGETYIKKNMEVIQKLGKQFKSYKIFFIENDSIDNTRSILKNFINEYNNIHGKFTTLGDKLHSTDLCKSSVKFNCSHRVQRLARLRNTLLNYVQYEMKFNGDYFIMLDFDFEFMPDPMELFRKMDTHTNIDAVFGMSLTPKQKFYDIQAIQPVFSKLKILLSFQKWIKVSSAFSGFGLYRWKSILDKRYNELTTRNEHISLNHQLSNLYVNTTFNIIYKPSVKYHISVTKFQSRVLFLSILILIFSLILKIFKYIMEKYKQK